MQEIKNNKGGVLVWIMVASVCFFAIMVLIMLLFTGTFKNLMAKKEEMQHKPVSVLETQAIKAEMDKINILIEKLKTQEKVLNQKKKELDDKELELRQFELQIEDKRSELVVLKDKLSKYIVEVNNTELSNIKKLAKMYASMKATDVVSIMEVSTDEIMVMILGRMKEKQAAKIIATYAGLDITRRIEGRPYSERAARLTQYIRKFRTEVVS